MNHQCNKTGSRRDGYPAYGKFDAHRYGPYGRGSWSQPGRRPKYNVPLNIAETEAAYEVYVYALGFDKADIKITVVDEVLHITGTRPVDEDNLPVFSRQEYPIRSFERMLSLNEAVDKTAISARQSEGVLILTLPKLPKTEVPAQEIKVD